MRARRRAATWLALLVVAIGAIAWQSAHRAAPRDDDDSPVVPLVALDYANWSAVELLYRGQRVRFERDAAAQWFAHQARPGEPGDHAHAAEPTAAERIDKSLATFSRARIERSIAVGAARRSNYGLDNPALIVLVHAADGRVAATIEVGQTAPDGLSRYVHLPPSDGVHTIPDYQVGGLLALLAGHAAPATER
jgi:hypothetical protein